MDGGLWENEMGIQTLRPHGLAPRTPSEPAWLRTNGDAGCPGSRASPGGSRWGERGSLSCFPALVGPRGRQLGLAAAQVAERGGAAEASRQQLGPRRQAAAGAQSCPHTV